jgi:hypothetical protein
MRLTLAALLLLLPVSGSVAAQATADHGTFLSKACGFQAKLPAGWRIKPSRSKKCVFTVIAPNRAEDEELELIVRDGTLGDGANDLGFTQDHGKWILQGEESVAAVQVESASWVGLQGMVATRVYENGHYSGLGDQARAVLFDRKHRVAELKCYTGDKVISHFVQGFEFLGEAPH